MEVEEEVECPVQDADLIKAAIIKIRKAAKRNEEDISITHGKIKAVREHNLNDGGTAVFYNEEDMTYYPVLIRK